LFIISSGKFPIINAAAADVFLPRRRRLNAVGAPARAAAADPNQPARRRR